MTAYEMGYRALIDGLTHHENPFDKDTAPYSFRRWLKGWQDSRKAHTL